MADRVNGLARVFSAILVLRPGGRVQVGEVLDAAAERGFGIVLFLIAFPAVIPILPPGASAVEGGFLILVAAQMLIGRPTPWMPGWIRKFTFSPAASEALQRHVLRWALRIERVSKPRLAVFTLGWALPPIALLVSAAGAVLILPLPFLNTLPAVAVMLIGIGLFNRDGLFVLIGATLCLAVVGLVLVGPEIVGCLSNVVRDVLG
ncbi:MAG: exopolysaccharide biosynthesis protein [Fimbriimonas sp.]